MKKASAAPKASPAAGAEPEAAARQAEYEEAKASLDYERDVKPLGLKLAAKDKQKLLSILSSYGAKKGTDLLPDQLPQFVTSVRTALGE